MGAKAADEVAQRINDLLTRREYVNMVFAAAPSQNEFLSALAAHSEVHWNRVHAFQMDEYVGLEKNCPQLFGRFLQEKLFDKVSLHSVHYLHGNVADVAAECARYGHLLKLHPPDIVCMGIGINNHIAFNDPHNADFTDMLQVKVVRLDMASREQQVHDGCFKDLNDVPSLAMTVTIPVLCQADFIFCIVPGASKAAAVYHTLKSNIDESHPSTILRNHPNAVLYLDQDSSSKIQEYI